MPSATFIIMPGDYHKMCSLAQVPAIFMWGDRFRSLTRWNETIFYLNQKFRTKKNFVKYRELLLKFWTKFAQLSSIFYGMNESYQNLANIRQFFQVLLTVFTWNLSGFYRVLMRNYEILWGFTRFYEVLQDFMKVYNILWY